LLLRASCGLGLTGIITDIKIRVEPAFRLREIKTPLPMTDLLKLASTSPGTQSGSEQTPLLSPTTKELAQDIGSHVVDFEDFGQGMLDRLAQSAEHVRLWYYPQSDQVMIAQANRIYEVSREVGGGRSIGWSDSRGLRLIRFHRILSRPTRFPNGGARSRGII